MELIEKIVTAESCSRGMFVPEMVQIPDAFGGLQSLIFIGDQQGDTLYKNGKERVLRVCAEVNMAIAMVLTPWLRASRLSGQGTQACLNT